MKCKPEYGEKLWGDDPVEFQSKLELLTGKDKEYASNFYRDGFLKLDSIVSKELCDIAVAAYDAWANKNCDTLPAELDINSRLPRVVNLHTELHEFMNLFSESEELLKVLDMLLGYRASVYTSLTFKYGTEQPIHIDTPVFRTAPEFFYFGVWIALEDADENNGCLRVLSGAHNHEPVCQYAFIRNLGWDVDSIPAGAGGLWSPYQDKIYQSALAGNFVEKKIPVKKGDVVIWHPQLPHGGSKVLDKSATRYSMVYHIVPEGTPVYQADVFFDERRKFESTESKKNTYTFGERQFVFNKPAWAK